MQTTQTPSSGMLTKRVVVLEHHSFLREQIVAVLRELGGYEVDDYETAEELLESLGSTQHLGSTSPAALGSTSPAALSSVDLVVVDLQSPDDRAKELIHALRQADPLLPLVLASSYRIDGELDEAFRTLPFLRKPFSVRELLETVETILEERAA